MTGLVLFACLLLCITALAMLQVGALGWSGAIAIFGLLSIAISFFWSGMLLILVAIGVCLLSFLEFRLRFLSKPIFSFMKKLMPPISDTERAALEGGTVNWDGELFSGRPNYEDLRDIPAVQLTDEEQAFIEGPLDSFCESLNDWQVRGVDKKISKKIWKQVSDLGLLGMLISKKHGGLGFSAQAQSIILGRIAARSPDVGVITMVPNSLGPGELIETFGTDEQKAHYLPRLAKGQEIPCFALTGEHSGSDAASMRDVGVVTKGKFKGKEVLGISLTWQKRYISLGPDATLLGLAFDLKDPEHLLGDKDHIGISLALVPTKHKGVVIGDRHLPSGSAFPNGPTSGENVFIPLEWVIGGKAQLGQGWRMLMSCLSAGRAISLPASSTSAAKQVLRATSAYAVIRRQFGINIGRMEGIEAPLARMIEGAYLLEASRAMTASIVSNGGKPAVISALLKYQSTEWSRTIVNDAMDIHGGRAICDGPSNYLQGAYQIIPVGITVEGANILTRSLITFSQGALRAHPFLLDEVTSVEEDNLHKFDETLCGHTKFMLANSFGALFHNCTGGFFATKPSDSKELGRYYQKLTRASTNFALIADMTIMVLGGDLKRRQHVTGRLADALSELYFISSVLKRFEDDGRKREDLPMVHYCLTNCLFRFYRALEGVTRNFPTPFVGFIMRRLAMPFGQRYRPASDALAHKIVQPVLTMGSVRDRLTRFLHVNDHEDDATGVLELAMRNVLEHKELLRKFEKLVKEGTVQRYHNEDWFAAAVKAGAITQEEAKTLKKVDRLIQKSIEVDGFDADLVHGVVAQSQNTITEKVA